MRTRKVMVVLETGEMSGASATITAELLLDEDGSVCGNGVISIDGHGVAFAATGTHFESLPPKARAGLA